MTLLICTSFFFSYHTFFLLFRGQRKVVILLPHLQKALKACLKCSAEKLMSVKSLSSENEDYSTFNRF